MTTTALTSRRAQAAAALTLTSLLVVGLGAVLRSAAGTITTAVAVLFAPPILGALVSNEVAALLLGAWAVGSLALGVVTLHRRNPYPYLAMRPQTGKDQA